MFKGNNSERIEHNRNSNRVLVNAGSTLLFANRLRSLFISNMNSFANSCQKLFTSNMDIFTNSEHCSLKKRYIKGSVRELNYSVCNCSRVPVWMRYYLCWRTTREQFCARCESSIRIWNCSRASVWTQHRKPDYLNNNSSYTMKKNIRRIMPRNWISNSKELVNANREISTV